MKHAGEKPNPFIDSDGYKKFVREMEETFEERVKRGMEEVRSSKFE